MPAREIQVINMDYNTLMANLNTYVSQYSALQNWNINDPTDPLMAVFTYYLLSLERLGKWANDIVQEFNIISARQRENIIDRALELGYSPLGNIASYAYFNITCGTAGSAFIAPAHSIVVSYTLPTGGKVLFDNDNSIYFGPSTTLVQNVRFTQGRFVTINRNSSSAPYQTILFSDNLAVNTLSVFVSNVQWTQIASLRLAGPNDQVYTYRQVANNMHLIMFGDNTNGAIPTNGATITVSYKSGGGSLGNINATDVINTIEVSPSSRITGVTNVTAAIGGADPESNDSIRVNAPLVSKLFGRLVSTTDVTNYCNAYPGVARAQAFAGGGSLVNIYVVPQGGGQPTQALIASLQADVSTRLPVGFYCVVSAPNYVAPTINITISVDPSYVPSQVATDVANAILNLINPLTKNAQGLYVNNFGSDLYKSDIVNAVMQNLAVVQIQSISTVPSAGTSGDVLIQLSYDQILTNVGATVNVTANIASSSSSSNPTLPIQTIFPSTSTSN